MFNSAKKSPKLYGAGSYAQYSSFESPDFGISATFIGDVSSPPTQKRLQGETPRRASFPVHLCDYYCFVWEFHQAIVAYKLIFTFPSQKERNAASLCISVGGSNSAAV